MGEVRKHILALLSVLGENIQFLTINYDVSRSFFVDVLYQIEVYCTSILMRALYHEWVLNFVNKI